MEFRPTVPQSVLRMADLLKQACFVFKFIERVMVGQCMIKHCKLSPRQENFVVLADAECGHCL